MSARFAIDCNQWGSSIPLYLPFMNGHIPRISTSQVSSIVKAVEGNIGGSDQVQELGVRQLHLDDAPFAAQESG